MNKNKNIFIARLSEIPTWLIFSFFWLILLFIYLPDFKAGWVLDAPAWLYHVRHDDLMYYLYRKQSQAESLYHFTQFITLVYYKLWGANVWLWSLLYITLQAINTSLFYVFFNNLFRDSGVKHAVIITITGLLLFTISPYISEVIIWKACYHYLQGLLFLMIILRCVQLYLLQPHRKYLVIAAFVFLLSAFSLEIFYTTPFFVAALCWYYWQLPGIDKKNCRMALAWFLIPEALIFVFYFIMLLATYHHVQPHVYNVFTQSFSTYFSKPVKYIFHLLFLGRFFSIEIKKKVYDFCELNMVIVGCYLIVLASIAWLFFKSVSNHLYRLLLLLVLFVGLTLAIIIPLPFPGEALLVFYDSYLYFAAAFGYMLLSFVLWQFTNKYFVYLALVVFSFFSLKYTFTLNSYWKQSAYINKRLLDNLPAGSDKITILLDLPECMNGVPMMGADPESEFKQMQQIINGDTSSRLIYDAASFNMMTMHDAAHVVVLNDSMLRVTLNQWGTWWFYEGHGGRSYETPDYKMNMTDVGHEYEITLKKPASQYLLLIQADCTWRIVDWNRKNEAQY